MENIHYNDAKRRLIQATVDFAMQKGSNYEEALYTTIQILNTADFKNTASLENLFSLYAVCFFDYYSLLAFRKTKGNLSKIEQIHFYFLQNLNSMMDLFYYWNLDLSCFANAVSACYQLQNSQIKSGMTQHLTLHDMNYLKSIYPMYEFDIQKYKTKKEHREN